MKKSQSLLGAAGIGLNRDVTERVEQIAQSTLTETKAIDKTDTTDLSNLATKKSESPRRSRNRSKPIESGSVHMQTVYVTDDDRERAAGISLFLKKSRQIKGQIGFSLSVRVALCLLEDLMQRDADLIIAFAKKLKQQPD